MFWDLGLAELALVMVAVVAGALTQGAIGMGFGMVVVPALALLAPDALPASPLIVTLPLTALMVARERRAIDPGGLPALLVGRVLGTSSAVWLLVVLTESALQILFGAVILLVTGLSLTRLRLRPTLPAAVTAGLASGLFSTTAAIGGPPVALLYQDRPGPELRATLSALFFMGGGVSLIGLLVAGRLALAHVGFAVLLSIPMTLGLVLSRRLARFLDGGWLRPAVLAFAASAGAIAVVRGLMG